MATLKELTWEFHKSAERSNFARKLLKGQLTESQYAEYLYNQLFIYEALEQWAEHAGILKGIEGICRAEAIKEDFNQLGGNFTIKSSAVDYKEHLYKLHEYDPEQLLAHIYVRHFGDLHGGQMIAKRVPGKGRMYKFDKGHDELKELVRARLDDSMADEAKLCFDFATKMFQQLGETKES